MPGSSSIPDSIKNSAASVQKQATTASGGALSDINVNPVFNDYQNELDNPTRSDSGFRNQSDYNKKTPGEQAVDKYVNYYYLNNGEAPSLPELQQVKTELDSRSAYAKDSQGNNYDAANYDTYDNGERTGFIEGGSLRGYIGTAISEATAAANPVKPADIIAKAAAPAAISNPSTTSTIRRIQGRGNKQTSVQTDLMGSSSGKTLLGG